MTQHSDESSSKRPTGTAASDLDTLLAQTARSIHQPLLVLDADMGVRYANPAFLKTFDVSADDTVGRPVFALANGQWDIPDLRRLLEEVLPRRREVEDFPIEHVFDTVGHKVMRVNARVLTAGPMAADTILIGIQDVTGQAALTDELLGRTEFTEKLIDSLREAVLVLTPELRVHSANNSFFDLFRIQPEKTINHYIWDLAQGQWDVLELRRLLEDILPQHKTLDDFQLAGDFDALGWRVMSLNARQLDHLNLILLTIHDLTDAALSERRLRESEHRFRVLVEASAQAVWETDADGVVRVDSPSWRAYTGQALEEGLGYGWLDAVHPDDRAYVERQWAEAVATGRNLDAEFRLRSAAGGWRWTNVRAAPMRNNRGEIEKWVGMNVDITERKAAEEALQLERDKLETVVENSSVGLVITNPEFTDVSMNAEALRIHGFDSTVDMLGHIDDYMDDFELRYPDGRPMPVYEWPASRAMRGEYVRDYDALLVRKSRGTQRYLQYSVVPVRDREGRVILHAFDMYDLTELKRVEAALRESEHRFRTMADGLPVIVWVHDAEGRQEFVNQIFCDYFGVSHEEANEDLLQGLIYPDDADAYLQEFQRCNRERRPFHAEARVRDAEGRWRWMESWGRPRFSSGNEYLGMVGTSVDITDRKKTESTREEVTRSLEREVAERTFELLEERNFIDTVLDQVPAPVMVVDAQQRIVRFNDACEATSGYRSDELIGRRDWLEVLVPPEERDHVAGAFQALLGGEAPQQQESHWCHRDGTARLFAWNNTVLRNADGDVQYIITTGADVTDLRKAEHDAREYLEEAARLQRLQTVNELGSYLAHELNQPLTAISLFGEAAKEQIRSLPPDTGAALASILGQISEQALRAGETIRRMRDFLRGGDIEATELDLNGIVEHACRLFRASAHRHHIDVHLDLDPDLPAVCGVDVHLEQVILNLLRNAAEAIRQAGMTQGEIVVETHRSHGRARVTVRDSGPGIDAATARALFTPLFTTKANGLGVGLSISHSLVAAHGGQLWVEPQAPGAVFHFEIPLENASPLVRC